ncbi:MAG: hypothetical protein WD044_08690 [Dongiaceae bacterium]
MIVYVTTRMGRRAITESYPLLPRDLRDRIRYVTYVELERQHSLPLATYIFADIERLLPPTTERAAAIWERLAASGEPVRLLNHPTRSLTRTRLLPTLFRDGINDFTVHPADAPPPPSIRYPVFLRGAEDHNGARSELIHDGAMLESELLRVEASGLRRRHCLIVEFCDTADAQGIYRKYDAYIAGDRILPTDIYMSSRWMLKWNNSRQFDGAPMSPAAMLGEEIAFPRDFAHADQLRAIARRAAIDYGRIDFSWLGDRIQIWEINTNPDLVLPDLYEPAHRASDYGQQVLPGILESVFAMLRSLDCDGDPKIRIPMRPGVAALVSPGVAAP